MTLAGAGATLAGAGATLAGATGMAAWALHVAQEEAATLTGAIGAQAQQQR